MSYGTNAPQGMVPVRYIGGASWNSTQVNTYKVLAGYATSIFKGDPVGLSNGFLVTGADIPAGKIIGCFQGCKYTDQQGIIHIVPYWPGGTPTLSNVNVEALATDAKDLLYNMQISATGAQITGGFLAPTFLQTSTGKTANYGLTALTPGGANPGVLPWWNSTAPDTSQQKSAQLQPNNPGAGNPSSGNSGYFLDSTTIAAVGAGANNTYRIVEITPIVSQNPNVSGLIFNNALVIINNHEYGGLTASV